jgi:hypothetical protein
MDKYRNYGRVGSCQTDFHVLHDRNSSFMAALLSVET